jgi:hypothetical protein
MNAEKMIIDLKGDRLLMGADFHTLEDKTQATFKTDQIPEFVKLVRKAPSDSKILITPSALVAWPAETDRYTKAIASCSLSASDALKEIAAIHGQIQPLAKFTEFLEKFKRFTNTAGLDFLGNLRHFKLKKIVKAEYNREKNGDFSAMVSLESAGNEDFDPPKTLVFEVPVFKFLPELADSIRLSFEVNFAIVQGESPALNFTLTNYAYADELLARQVEIINRHLGDLTQDKLWGSQEITQQDDSWKYEPNPLADK